MLKAVVLILLIASLTANFGLLVLGADIYDEIQVLRTQYEQLQGDYRQREEQLKNALQELKDTLELIAKGKLSEAALMEHVTLLESENDQLRKNASTYTERAKRTFE